MTDDDLLAEMERSDPPVPVGSFLVPFVAIVMLCACTLSMTQLASAVAAVRRARDEVHGGRAQALAEAGLERARNIINAAPYRDGVNTALQAAMDAAPRVVPGTDVSVAAAGDAGGRWFVLRAVAQSGKARRAAQARVRQSIPAGAYHYYVAEDGLGITGSGRGRVHSNKTVAMLFPDGVYGGTVTAAQGFQFLGGASPENTRLLGAWNDRVVRCDLLDGVDCGALAGRADALRVLEPYVAEVDLEGAEATVRLYLPERTLELPAAGRRRSFGGYEQQPVSRRVPVFRVAMVPRSQPIFENRQGQRTVREPIVAERTVQGQQWRRVWIESDDPEAGPGGWQQEPFPVEQLERHIAGWSERTVRATSRVKVGENRASAPGRVLERYDLVEVTEERPAWRETKVAGVERVVLPEELVATVNVPAEGMMFFAGPVRRLAGRLVGRLSIVSEAEIRITGNLQYVDADGQARMLHGTDPEQDYVPNPVYRGRAALRLMARGDVRYAVEAPPCLEVNAALISLEGMVGFDGLEVATGGEEVSWRYQGMVAPETLRTKDSLRRLGSVISRRRPVAALLSTTGEVVAGFRSGRSAVDPALAAEADGGNDAFVLEHHQPFWAHPAQARRQE